MSEPRNLWGLRFLALALALLTWFTVSVEKREHLSEKVVEAQITYNSPEDQIILNPVEKVRVRLRGNSSRVRALNPFLVNVVADLGKGTFGSIEFHLAPENVIMPEGFEVVSIEPNVISLEVDKRITQLLPVNPRLSGEPAAGAIVTNPTAEPDMVLVSGPESRIRAIAVLSTTAVDLTTHAIDFRQQAAVVSPDPLVKVVSPSVVTVSVPMEIPGTNGSGGSGASNL